MASYLLTMTLALRLIIYEFLLLKTIIVYDNPALLNQPNRFPNMTGVRLTYQTIKNEVDHHYATVLRLYYEILVRS